MSCRDTLFVNKNQIGQLINPDTIHLNCLQKLQLTIEGCTYIGKANIEGYKETVKIFLVCCPEHGYYLDFPHGYKEYFTCLKCLEKRIETAKVERLEAANFSLLSCTPLTPAASIPTNQTNRGPK